MIFSLVIITFLQMLCRVLAQSVAESESNWNQNDPDVMLCKDMTIDAAVMGDDGGKYVFKGDYYWLIDKNGRAIASEYGELISERWPEVEVPIDAAFTFVDENVKWSTVFITVSPTELL